MFYFAVVLNALRQLCTTTDILSNPDRLQAEARAAANKGGRHSSSQYQRRCDTLGTYCCQSYWKGRCLHSHQTILIKSFKTLLYRQPSVSFHQKNLSQEIRFTLFIYYVLFYFVFHKCVTAYLLFNLYLLYCKCIFSPVFIFTLLIIITVSS